MDIDADMKGVFILIEINHLVKKYGNHVAVNDLSLKVEDGKIYGFLGPNGAGKSTTMNIITGYLAATSGEVKVNGYDVLKNPEEAKKSIGYLPELPPVYMDMTVMEYLKFVAELKKIPKKDTKAHIDEIIDMTKLNDVSGRMIRNLSKGYRQRVGLAQALIGYPDVIILDEPTVGLDPKQIIEIRELIKSLKKKHTVILSSHIMQEINAVCDYVFIISKGKLVASDNIENIGNYASQKGVIEVVIKGEETDINMALQGIDAITSSNMEKTDDGMWKVVINTSGDRDIREELFYALSERKLPIMYLNKKESSLEEIFLELTESQNDEKESNKEEEDNVSNL